MPEQLISIDPATGKKIAEYSVFDEKKVESALKHSVKAFAEWRALHFSKRAVVLRNIAKEIRKEKDNLVKLATKEMGQFSKAIMKWRSVPQHWTTMPKKALNFWLMKW